MEYIKYTLRIPKNLMEEIKKIAEKKDTSIQKYLIELISKNL